MKKLAKNIVASILGWQVRRLRKHNDFVTIGVVGSIGKTSTKFAIARVLSKGKKVRFQEGNYNDKVSVPLIFFGHSMPNVMNIFAWIKIVINNEKTLRRFYPYEVVVVELGTDGPGQIAEFRKYLALDYTVVTAITPEHMEYFSGLDAVAEEELSVAEFSSSLLVNADLSDEKYIQQITKPVITYGQTESGIIQLRNIKFKSSRANFQIVGTDLDINAQMEAVSTAELYSATVAATIAHKLGLSEVQIKEGISELKPVAGRMQRLEGIKNSLIIDETYNASPVAVMAALDSLYAMKGSQKIAILGNMNELGALSEEAHRDIGKYCEPMQLDLVVTIGPDANEFTAMEAKANGCQVATFNNPYDAGEFVRDRLKSGAIILAKGSQNGVFAEEAVKLLLKNKDDEKRLVRQDAEWLKKKQRNFTGGR
jgi:UDP-N-acetylmuramoyl-tripeptide--D-alanyl-D-alanine ligase